MSQSGSSSFAAVPFAAKPGAAKALIECALPLIADRPNARILDLGCGNGAVAISAASARPDITVTALDISPSNIAATTKAAEAAGVGGRVTAVCGDYLLMPSASYDLIISDSVLQLIGGSDDVLATHLARDLTERGFVVAATPIESFGNRLRVLLRRLWRPMPGSADTIVLALAALLYPQVPKDVLADRIPYLRVLPTRLYGPAMVQVFARHGLDVVRDTPWPSESAAKLTHSLIVWRRRT